MGLSASQWAEVRRVWETSPQTGYVWLIEACGLSISASAISKRALREGWKKRVKTSADNTLDMFEGDSDNRAETSPKGRKAGARKSKGGEEKEQGSSPRSPRERKPAAKRAKKARPFDDLKELSDEREDKDSQNSWEGTHELDIKRNPFGRPKAYHPEYARQAFKLCLLGSTDEDLANFFETSLRTIYNWKHNHPEFLHALRRGKTEADADVAASLFQRAIGLQLPKAHVVAYQGHVKIIDLVEHIPGDVSAQKMWLYNRAPDRWKAEPEPPAPPAASLFPSDDEQREIYERSHEVTRERAQKARERRERLGLFDGSKAVPVEASIKGLMGGRGGGSSSRQGQQGGDADPDETGWGDD